MAAGQRPWWGPLQVLVLVLGRLWTPLVAPGDGPLTVDGSLHSLEEQVALGGEELEAALP